MSPWELAYPAASVVLLGAGVRLWGQFARSGRWLWFALGVVSFAFGVDGLRALTYLLRFRGSSKRYTVYALVAFALCWVVFKTWRSLGPAAKSSQDPPEPGEAVP